jgi:transaldolase/glucose-6-phosphate isomerase
MNPLQSLESYGQAVWLDFVARGFVAEGKLKRLVDEDGLKGVTSNPSIFEKAIGHSEEYDSSLKAAADRPDLDVMSLFEDLAVEDIKAAADVLRPVYDTTRGTDGYVSLEVSPYLAMSTEETVAEARRLWKAVDRPNLMIKVPATAAGLPAIRQLLSEGINVNITLLFSQDVYEQVALAYLDGLEAFAAAGGDVSRVASVASFFVSRIDSAVDKLIDERLRSTFDTQSRAALEGLKGKVAIANAKLAYQRYQRLFAGPRWEALEAKGARPQRLLWASTGTKNPAYSDVLYVEELIGPDTVNTMPPATMDAFRDHGKPRNSLQEDVADAEQQLATLARFGISLDQVTAKLVEEGVKLFVDAADQLLGAVAGKRVAVLGAKLDGMTAKLPEAVGAAVKAEAEAWRAQGKVRRLWERDASVWTGTDEAKWLGWLDIVDHQIAEAGALERFAEEVRREGFRHVLLLGMGGSSLGPEVLARTFGRQPGAPEMLVLDSTDPSQIRSLDERIDIAKTLFIVASKSGSTLEPNIFKQYFFDRAKQVVGAEKAGRHFVAITDPGSKMQQVAEQDRFRHVFFGVPEIGGRYSILSHFGTVPAAAMGLDLCRFLETTRIMVRSCGRDVPPAVNPGVQLGLMLGVAAKQGRDKVTLIASPRLADFGAWAEQLIAESTGKQGKALIPVDAEPLGAPSAYGDDRVFVHLRIAGEAVEEQEQVLAALEGAGHPVVRIELADPYQLGQEFFRWEIATAVAGAVIGINPFDQPDVEASKVKTRELTAQFEKTGRLPAETPLLEEAGIRLYADPKNADSLASAAREKTLAGYLRAHLDRLGRADYFAVLAYIEHNAANTETLQRVRAQVRDRKRVATCLGFGPRFLHSTGQAYKGGSDSGVFLQLTCDEANDLLVPDQRYSFGVVKAAQAQGDLAVLSERGRRALRVHLGPNVSAGLAALVDAVRRALAAS